MMLGAAGAALAQDAAPASPSSSDTIVSAPDVEPVFEPEPLPPPARPVPSAAAPLEKETGYGRKNSMHLGLSFGLGSDSGGMRFAGGLGFGYFLISRVAPGVDLNVSGGSGVLTTTSLTGTLRLVPIRTDNLSIFLIGRAGRLFISGHDDTWVAGGGAGAVVPFGRSAGLVISYEILGLWPSSHCSDLANGCRLDSFGLGLILGL